MSVVIKSILIEILKVMRHLRTFANVTSKVSIPVLICTLSNYLSDLIKNNLRSQIAIRAAETSLTSQFRAASYSRPSSTIKSTSS